MTELERALVALGRELDVPAPAPLAALVRERIALRRRRRRAFVLAAATALVAVGIAFAVPPARSAILRFFHIGAATVERVETLPPAQERPLAAGLGPVRSRREAERVAGFELVLPPRAPSRYYARPEIAAAFLPGLDRVLLVELSGDQTGFAKKFVSPSTTVEPVEVSGVYFGIWLEGAEHVVRYFDRSGREQHVTTRLAGNVLLWAARGRTFRLEGAFDRKTALRIAGTLTP